MRKSNTVYTNKSGSTARGFLLAQVNIMRNGKVYDGSKSFTIHTSAIESVGDGFLRTLRNHGFIVSEFTPTGRAGSTNLYPKGAKPEIYSKSLANCLKVQIRKYDQSGEYEYDGSYTFNVWGRSFNTLIEDIEVSLNARRLVKQ